MKDTCKHGKCIDLYNKFAVVFITIKVDQKIAENFSKDQFTVSIIICLLYISNVV